MTTTHNLGFPRIGLNRELKFGLESYWSGKLSESTLNVLAADICSQNWSRQGAMDFVTVGDFSFYDHVLDTSLLLGHLPKRASEQPGSTMERYFRVARGRASADASALPIQAGELTKWFDTNYHYIVPEFSADTEFELHPELLLDRIEKAKQFGYRVKPVIIGPLTYLWLGKANDVSDKLNLLDRLVPVYRELLEQLHLAGVEWVQIDEPILVTDLEPSWQQAFSRTYHRFNGSGVNLLLATYFGQLQANLQLACELCVQGIHLDAVNAPDEVAKLIDWLPSHKVLSLGIVDGRNIWKSDLTQLLDWLKPIHERLRGRLWIAPSCSLLHVPVDLESESEIDPEIRSWLAFAQQKLDEITTLALALDHGREAVAETLEENRQCLIDRADSPRRINPRVRQELARVDDSWSQRGSPYAERAKLQTEIFSLPPFPTTTIGSYPQTDRIREARKRFRNGRLDPENYRDFIRQEIKHCIVEQEQLGLDVLVHGEAERNDMVEYFGEQLDGFALTQQGWVQSYGSRCVKPPIIFGDVSRPRAITEQWIKYAQSLTDKPVKGMLTGPVTILNWSFVRNDQSREDTCLQLALAIRDEVNDLEQAGVGMIQIDEAALREGLPLRRSQWDGYLEWAVRSFRITAGGVKDSTQIHSHMCYSEFNDIMTAIVAMDADIITIESSRSNQELLDIFKQMDYPNQIGPGVYDIHSPNIPSTEAIVDRIRQAVLRIPRERLWINPDCGLKTRTWPEVRCALQNMVEAAYQLRMETEAAAQSPQSATN